MYGEKEGRPLAHPFQLVQDEKYYVRALLSLFRFLYFSQFIGSQNLLRLLSHVLARYMWYLIA